MTISREDTNNDSQEAAFSDENTPLSEAQATLNDFWPTITDEIKRIKTVDAKNQVLPLARIKKIMKLDEDVKMISAEAPLLFAKAAEVFIQELTLRAWVHTEDNKRRTLQRNDIAMAITKFDQFDFLIDIVPREEVKPVKKENETKPLSELRSSPVLPAARSTASTGVAGNEWHHSATGPTTGYNNSNAGSKCYAANNTGSTTKYFSYKCGDTDSCGWHSTGTTNTANTIGAADSDTERGNNTRSGSF